MFSHRESLLISLKQSKFTAFPLFGLSFVHILSLPSFSIFPHHVILLWAASNHGNPPVCSPSVDITTHLHLFFFFSLSLWGLHILKTAYWCIFVWHIQSKVGVMGVVDHLCWCLLSAQRLIDRCPLWLNCPLLLRYYAFECIYLEQYAFKNRNRRCCIQISAPIFFTLFCSVVVLFLGLQLTTIFIIN